MLIRIELSIGGRKLRLKKTWSKFFIYNVLLFACIFGPSYFAAIVDYFNGMGFFLLLLFFVYPIISFNFGSWMYHSRTIIPFLGAIIIAADYLILFSVFYNSTAYVYVPFYLVCFIMGVFIKKYKLKRGIILR